MDRQKTRLALRQVLFLQFTWKQIQVRLSIVVPMRLAFARLLASSTTITESLYKP